MGGPRGEFWEFDPSSVSRIAFPFHALDDLAFDGEAAAPTIGVLAQADAPTEVAATYESLHLELQKAAYLAGIHTKFVPQEDLLRGAELTPIQYPVIASVDPRGEYLETVEEEGDVGANLARYVEQGGVLLLFSRGGALRTPIISSGEKFYRARPEGGLSARLGLRTIHPGEGESTRVDPFDRPPNSTLALSMELADPAPAGLSAMPKRLQPRPMLNAVFYPMMGARGELEWIYTLANEEGRVFGPVLSRLRYGRGHVICIDHLVWYSQFEGEPFTREILPLVLAWSVREAG